MWSMILFILSALFLIGMAIYLLAPVVIKLVIFVLVFPFIGFIKAYEIRETQPVMSKVLVTIYTILWLFIILMGVITIQT